MSTVIYEAQAAALRGITSSEKVVALILAARMNSKLPGWGGRPVTMPKITDLARDAELDKRTISRAISTLAERGIIEITRFRKPDGNLSRNYYVWTADKSDAYTPNWMATSNIESSNPLERMTPEQEAAAAQEGVHPLTWIQAHPTEIPRQQGAPDEEGAEVDMLPIDAPTPAKPAPAAPQPARKDAEKPVDGFDEWWKQYPKKVGKLDAKKAYRAAIKQGATPQDLLDGLQRHTANWKAKNTEPQYIPHPASWLRKGRWEDEFTTPAPNQTAPAINPVTGKALTRKDFWYACVDHGIDPSPYVNFWKPSMGLPGDPGWANAQAYLDRYTGRG